jgi:hypothetical protein
LFFESDFVFQKTDFTLSRSFCSDFYSDGYSGIWTGDLYKSFGDLYESLGDLYKSFGDLYKSLGDLYKSIITYREP